MAYSPIEESYMNGLVQAQFPTPEPEPVLLAENTGARPTQQPMTDTGGGAAVGTRLKMPSGLNTPENMQKVGSEIIPAGAAIAKGGAQASVGMYGDIEGLGRMVLNYMGVDVNEQTKLPTTEEVKGFLDKYIPVDEKYATFEKAGEIVSPAGAYGLGKAGVKAIKATEGLPIGLSIKDVSQTVRPNVVSTRFPTAVKATENPIESNLIIDYDTIKKDPVAFQHNMGLIESYPNFTSKAPSVEGKAEDFINEVKSNLLFLHDAVPEATRQRSKLWYDGARKIVDDWTTQYDAPDDAIAGVLAVLSPQKDWFMNVSLGQRVLDISKTKQSFVWDKTMDSKATEIWSDPKYNPILDLVRNKSYGELKTPEEKALWLRTYDESYNPREHSIVNPEGTMGDVRLTDKGEPYKTGWGSLNEIGKAINILENPTVENISRSLGTQHKVRNFYNNIYDPSNPNGHVTIDTHAVAAGLMRPLSGKSREVAHNFSSNVKGEVGPKNSSVSGVQGTYGLYAEAYRRAAQERGVLPREMQSITWEAVRGLFPDSFKNPKNNELVDNIWLQYKNGQISQEEARNAVFKSANGINPPEWEGVGLRGKATPTSQPTSNAGELSGVSVPTGTAGELGSGKRAGVARKNKSVKANTTLVEENK